jgi:hypothetical protein
VDRAQTKRDNERANEHKYKMTKAKKETKTIRGNERTNRHNYKTTKARGKQGSIGYI